MKLSKDYEERLRYWRMPLEKTLIKSEMVEKLNALGFTKLREIKCIPAGELEYLLDVSNEDAKLIRKNILGKTSHNVDIREALIEGYLAKMVKKKLKTTAFKFSSPGNSSVVDRIIPLTMMTTLYVEVKRPGAFLTRGQINHARLLRGKGHVVECVDNKTDVDILIREWENYV